MRKQGFTMIEVLNVIVITAILAAILFPAFGKSREKARSIHCRSNLVQLSLAMHLYAEDWGGRFPAGPRDTDVARQIYPYLNNFPVFDCPSAPKGWTTFRAPRGVGAWWEEGEEPEFSLAYKFSKGLTIDSSPHRRLIWEWARTERELFRHSDGANVAFLGGAVRWVSAGEWLAKGWPLPRRGGGRR